MARGGEGLNFSCQRNGEKRFISKRFDRNTWLKILMDRSL